MSGRGWLLALGVFLLVAIASAGVLLGTRAVLRRRLRRWARTALWQFRARTDRYKLVERDRIREALLQDPRIEAAIAR